MYFYHDNLLNHALSIYSQFDFNDPAEGDRFFNTFSPGNTIYIKDRPYERFSDYEELLNHLRELSSPQKPVHLLSYKFSYNSLVS
jgi:hypothetical protein